MVLICALRVLNPRASMAYAQGHAGEKGLGDEFGHPCPSMARPTLQRERFRGPLSNAIGKRPENEARPPHTWGLGDFSGLIPQARGVWVQIGRCPYQVTWAFSFHKFVFLSVSNAVCRLAARSRLRWAGRAISESWSLGAAVEQPLPLLSIRLWSWFLEGLAEA